jgi:hypothetical protein
VSVSPCPWVLVRALGPDLVKQRAEEGDRAAQFSVACSFIGDASGALGYHPAAGTSPSMDVGLHLALCTLQIPVAHQI